MEVCHSHGHPNATFRALLFQCFIILAAGMMVCSCNVPTKIADEIARGTDEITATVNGTPYTFEVKGGTNYFGIHTSGVSGRNSIGLNLGYGLPGKTTWNGDRYSMNSGPDASWNGAYALRGLGYLNVIQHDADLEIITGTFEFMTIDPATKDTIRVTDGTFRVHYITTD